MPNILRETLGAQGWPGGVVLGDPTLVGASASPRGLNSALALTTTGVPYVGKRQGIGTMNTTAITGSPATLGMFDYYRIADDTFRHVIAPDGGRIDRRNDTTITAIDATGLTAGTLYPDFAVANDLLFIVNGTDRKKYNGTAVTNFGITRPTVGTMGGAAGVAGSPNGTYELRVTYANSGTGHESSASATASATVVVVSQKIDVTNIPVSSDTQVDTRYIYVRNTSTMTQFYRAGTISDNTTTSLTLEFADATITTAAPGTSENDRPPSGVKYLALYQGRLFAASDSALYYSAVDEPESFDALAIEYVNQSDGQKITGICAVQDTLLIFKEGSVYTLNGADPTTWEIDRLSDDYGCGSHRTIKTVGDSVYWFGRQGIVRYTPGGNVDTIGMRLYGSIDSTVNYDSILTASACKDEQNFRYIVALPGTGQTRATFMLPLNITLGVLESSKWDPMDAATLGEATDSDGMQRAYLGNYAGQIFRVWDTTADGVPSGTVTGTFVASGTSVTTVTDLTAAFYTTGAGLVERKVTILDSDGDLVTTGNRPRISSNTATAVTLNTAVTGLTNAATYTYIIGGPDFQWDTYWSYLNTPWVKKRFEYLFTLVKGTSSGASAKIDVAFDWDDANANAKQISLTLTGASGVWDDADSLWDQSVWDSTENIRTRHRIGRVGFAMRARYRNAAANQSFAFLMVGTQAASETTKR